MGPAFFETKMGQRFYEVTAPRIASELANIATALGALHTLLRERLPAPSKAPPAPASPSPEHP
jgi:hypothetical protein